MSIVCANALNEEYAVIGTDLPSVSSYWKIASINDGFFPVTSSDPKVEEYYLNAKKKGNFYATYDTFSYKFADIVITIEPGDPEKPGLIFENKIKNVIEYYEF